MGIDSNIGIGIDFSIGIEVDFNIGIGTAQVLLFCLLTFPFPFPEDCLTDAKGECVICLEDLSPGDIIARLPCLCIYHKV